MKQVYDEEELESSMDETVDDFIARIAKKFLKDSLDERKEFYNDCLENTDQKKEEYINAVKGLLYNREIEYLVHFTQGTNLENIMKYGLLTSLSLQEKQIKYERNDRMRLDGRDALCLSVTFPNYKTFYKFRRYNSNAIWVVLLIDPRVIVEKFCKFYYTNAANGVFIGRNQFDLMSFSDFENMFAEWGNGKWERSRLGTPLNETTNPQAEIRVLEDIEKEYIKKIVVEYGFAEQIKEFLDHKYDDIIVDDSEYEYRRKDGNWTSYFDKRPDYKSWYKE